MKQTSEETRPAARPLRRLGRFLLGTLLLLAGAAAGICCLRAMDRINSSIDALAQLEVITEEETLNAFTVEQLLVPVSQLTTLQFCYQDVDLYHDSKQIFGQDIPFTEEQILYTYSGTVHAGVDLAKAVITVDNDAQIIRVQLPAPTVFAHEIDENSFAFYTVKDSIFTQTRLDKFTAQIADLKAVKERQLAMDGDFYAQVLENACQVVEGLLLAADSTGAYSVEFAYPEAPAKIEPGRGAKGSGDGGDSSVSGGSGNNAG